MCVKLINNWINYRVLIPRCQLLSFDPSNILITRRFLSQLASITFTKGEVCRHCFAIYRFYCQKVANFLP